MVRNLNVAIIEKRKEALEKRRAEYWQDELQKKKEEFERDGFRALTLDDNGPVPVHTLSNSAVCAFYFLFQRQLFFFVFLVFLFPLFLFLSLSFVG